MTTYSSFNPTALRAGDFPMLSRPVTILSGSNASGAVLPRGAVLGIVTASGKYTLSAAAAGDGSAVPRCVLAADCDASAGDVTAPAYFTGEFADAIATFGVGHTQATVDLAWQTAGVPLFMRKVGLVP